MASAYNTLGDCLRAAGRPKDALIAYLHTDVLFAKDKEQHPRAPETLPHSVEMLGSAWTFCGTIIRKLLVASAARSRTRSASSSWPVARSSVA